MADQEEAWTTGQPGITGLDPLITSLRQVHERLRQVRYPTTLWVVGRPFVWDALDYWMRQLGGRSIYAHNLGIGVRILYWEPSKDVRDLAWLRAHGAEALGDAPGGMYLQMSTPPHVELHIAGTDEECRMIAGQVAETYRRDLLGEWGRLDRS